MDRTTWEVGPQGDQWYLKRQGAERAASLHNRKEDAIEAGASMGRANQPSQLLIKQEDGTIEDERTYGSDPYPPAG